MAQIDPFEERAQHRGRLTSLSAVGAAVAGAGVGVAFADKLGAAMWPLLLIGLVVHLWGMVGARRLNAAAYVPSRAELFGYWICWAIVAAGAAYVLVLVLL